VLFKEDSKQNEEYFKSKLSMPVLALGSAQSLGPVMVNMAKEIATNVRGGVIERCGHWVADERPAYLAEQLRAFFNEEK
jgi:pimeloyl-ACP methyl ester carboxylesterase